MDNSVSAVESLATHTEENKVGLLPHTLKIYSRWMKDLKLKDETEKI